jgi:phenylalanyl-tRNA synthetase alpha chain
MNESLETLRHEVLERIDHCNSETEVEEVRVETLGRSGRLTSMLRGLKDLPPEERPRTGEQLNRLRKLFEEKIEERFRQIKQDAKGKALNDEWIDITLSTRWERGRVHRS